jgi:hypothetical protein
MEMVPAGWELHIQIQFQLTAPLFILHSSLTFNQLMGLVSCENVTEEWRFAYSELRLYYRGWNPSDTKFIWTAVNYTRKRLYHFIKIRWIF